MNSTWVIVILMAAIPLLFWSDLWGKICKTALRLGWLLLSGSVILLLFNAAAALVDYNLAFNPITAFIVGWGQIPGLLLLAALNCLY